MTKIEIYSASAQSNDGSAAKGTSSNPYTVAEYESMLDNGTWTGGYVENMGYCLKEVVVTASYPDSDSMDSDDSWPSDDFWPSDGSSPFENGTNPSGGSGTESNTSGGGSNGNGNSGNGGSHGGSNTQGGNNVTNNNNVPKNFPVPLNNISKAGVRVYAERVNKSSNSTLSRFTAAAYNEDGHVISEEIFTGYFLERAYNLDKATTSGSQTAILAGEYQIVPGLADIQTYDWYLKDVPGRSGIAIHVGNYYKDSSGCLLIGKTFGTSGEDYTVAYSRVWMEKLSSLLRTYGGNNIVISITDAF